MNSIEIAIVGDMDPSVVEYTAEGISSILGTQVHSPSVPLPLPHDAYNVKRKQYCSTDLLKYLQKESRRKAWRCLGLIDVDIYAPRLNYVFGEAVLNGPVGVISLTRLRPGFYGQPHDEALFLRRIVIEAVHELGHTYGLHHCPDPHCVMRFSSHIEDSDRKGYDFCPRCAYPLHLALRAA